MARFSSTRMECYSLLFLIIIIDDPRIHEERINRTRRILTRTPRDGTESSLEIELPHRYESARKEEDSSKTSY